MAKISEVKVYPLKKEHPKIKANGTLLIDDAWKIKFAVFNGPKGLFVGWPGRYGDKVDEETGKKPWYADVQIIDPEVHKQVGDAVLKVYNEQIGNTSLNQGEAAGPTNQDDNIPF